MVRLLFVTLWAFWQWVGRRIQNVARRESWLATFGPSAVIAMFLTWALAFMLGYALILDGLRTQVRPALDGFSESFYFSATTIVPLSYGDFVPIGWGARVMILFESATGVGIAALVITLLFSLYASFQEREEMVVQLDALAGAPPSGTQLLETVFERGLRDELVKTFEDWRGWSAAVLESHLAYPILLYFRSSHDNEAWLNSFGAVMDAATLVMSAVDEDEEGPARLMFTVGNHLVEDLSWYFRFTGTKYPLVARAAFEQAVARLRKAGFRVKSGGEADTRFSPLREKSASKMNQVAPRRATTPAEGIGARTSAPHVAGRGRPRRRLP